MTGEGAMNAAAVVLGDLGNMVSSIEDKMRLATLWMEWAARSEMLDRYAAGGPWGVAQAEFVAANTGEESDD